MKKITILLLAFVTMIFVGLYQSEMTFAVEPFAHVEDFTNSNLTASYADGSFIGIDNITWTYKASRDHNNDTNNSGINGKAIMLRRTSDGSSIKSSTISGGISSFEVKLYKGFTGGGDRQVELLINNISKGTSTPFDNFDEHVFRLDNLNIEGDFTIEIKNITSSQVIVDDISWNSYTTDLKATINQLFGVENSIPVTIDAVEYGQDITIPIAQSSGENNYRFAVINGVVNSDFKSSITMPITDGLDVSLVYASESKHAVLFVDSNGKLISHSWVNNGEDVIAPEIVNISKPGYIISAIPWLSNEGSSSLEGINSSRVYTLQYTLSRNPVQVTVNGGTPIEYAYNEIVTITATNLENFKAWMENGKVVSTNPTYTFTALTDRVLVESTDAALVENKVVLSDDLKLRSGYQTFVGQLSLGENEVLVEYGLVVTNNGLLKDEELTLSNATKVKSDVLNPATNEFMLSIGEEYLVVRAYVVVRNELGQINTYYSENQYNDAVIVTFETDGGTEVDSIAVKTGSVISVPTEPNRPSHEFLGWFDGDAEFNFENPVNEDVILIAHWNEVLPTIEQVINLTLGTTTEFVGVVTGIDGKNLFIQDNTAAIYVYNANLPVGLVVGDKVRVNGARAQYNGLNQIGSGAMVTIESRNEPLPEILSVTDLGALGANAQSKRISTEQLVLTVKSLSGSNLTLTDGINDLVVFAHNSTISTHIGTAILGQKVEILEGYVDWFSGLQVKVLNAENLVFIELTDAEKVQLDMVDFVNEYNDKSFNMDTLVPFKSTGSNGTTISWTVLEPEGAIEMDTWFTVIEDTLVELEIIVTKGEATDSEIILVTILFVDDSQPLDPVTIINFVSEGKAKLPSGWTSNGLGNDYAGSRLRFDSTGDWLTTNSLGIMSGTVIRVTISANMNTSGTEGSGQLELKSGSTLLGTINLNKNALSDYTVEITLTVDLDKLTFNFIKNNGNLGLASITLIANPN